ncbi:ImuA family protein [Sphingobacterium corticis]|uniref:ImuA family protein n=1 Tax=Sphingobacterium corticis TaxID=1812823 RepID=A0ABW5NLM9_9SPHI
MMIQDKSALVKQLQRDILGWQGVSTPYQSKSTLGLGVIEQVFPHGTFPLGCVHEFLGFHSEDRAASSGFIAGILSKLMEKDGVCFWISTSPIIYPPAMSSFGISPDRLVFVRMSTEREVLWAVEEALKCKGLAAVVGEVSQLSFVESRRLQLAVEESRVTGFILRRSEKNMHATACVARWQIRSLPSAAVDELPGIGFPCWEVSLLKVRNGKTGKWKVSWLVEDGFTLEKPMTWRTLEAPRKIG